MVTEKKILGLLFERSEHAIGELERKYGNLCRKVARNILGNSEDVEETVSDAFLAVWSRVPPERPDSLSAYISRITRNLALTRRSRDTAALRDVRLNVALSELEEILPGGEDPALTVESRLITETINRYLATQNETNRAIFVRRYYLLESGREISRATGLTEQAIRSRLLRMREGLREALRKEDIFV